jgi:hypothetical protein
MEPEQTEYSMAIVKDGDYYEKQRADNIARNNAFLRQLEINIDKKASPEKQCTQQKSQRRSGEDSDGDSSSDESVLTATTCNSINSVEAGDHAEFSSSLAEKVGKYFADTADGGRFKVITILLFNLLFWVVDNA